MSIYWFACIAAVILDWVACRFRTSTLQSGRKGGSLELLFLASSCLVLILFTGLRDVSVGIDTEAYYANYIETGLNSGWTMEYGYHLLVVFCIRIGLGPTGLFILCSTIFFGFSYATIHRVSTNPVLSVYLLFAMGHLFFYMNAMRQMMAAAILLYSIRYIIDRKIIWYILFVCIAASLHTSSIVFLPMYFAANLSVKPLLIVSIIAFVICFSNQISSLLVLIAQLTKYESYFLAGAWTNDPAGIVGNLKNISVLAFALYASTQSKEHTKTMTILIWLQVISVLTGVLAMVFPMFGRFQYTFALGGIALIPISVSLLPDKKIAFLATMVIVLLYGIYAQYAFGVVDSMGTLPYKLTSLPVFS